MNTAHFPSLELCHKLTEIGFPETERDWLNDGGYENGGEKHAWISKERDEKEKWVRFRCPSVMEMLDEMPDTISQEYLLRLWKNNDRQYGVVFQEVNGNQIGESGKGFETLPNALAEMILWLSENNFISFSK